MKCLILGKMTFYFTYTQQEQLLLIPSKYNGSKITHVHKSSLGIQSMLRSIFYLCSAMVIVAMLAEIFLRLFIILPAATMADKELGWLYKPNAEILHTSEGYSKLALDEYGFNNDSRADISNFVIVLGDSYTEAFQVGREENFVSTASGQQSCVNFYNAGRSGMSFLHYLVLHPRLTEQLKTNRLAIFTTPGDLNDLNPAEYSIQRNARTGEIETIEFHSRQLSKSRVFLDPILSQSSLATYLMNRAKLVLANKSQRANKGHQEDSTDNLQVKSEIVKYVFTRLSRMADLKIFYIPVYDYLPNRQSVEKHLSVSSRKVIEVAAEQSSVPFIVIKELDKAYSQTGKPPVGFNNKSVIGGHLNELGHAVVARNLGDSYDQDCQLEVGLSL
jgi:hypothetical protein